MNTIRTLLLPFPLFWLLGLDAPAAAQVILKPDAGRYTIEIQETEFGTDSFTADAVGGVESEIAFSQAGKKVKLHVSIRADVGRLKEVEAVADPGGKFRLTIAPSGAKLGTGGALQKELAMKDIAVSKRLFPYSTIAPEQLRMVLAAYDTKLGGPQVFDVCYTNGLGPSGLILGKLTVTAAGSRQVSIDGRTIAIVQYRLAVPTPVGDIDAEIYTDSDLRVLLFRMQSQKLLVVRDGYQPLTKPEAPADPTLSAPNFTITTDKNVRILMRDGVTLAADVTRPDAPGKFPVILERTCYGRQNALEASFYARRGYVFVAQDVRGKFESEGEWRPWINEARDGGDTLEWCARQRWSNGDIGMFGASYLGFVQWAAARENNRHLKCLIPIVSPPDPFFNVPYAFGSLYLYGTVWWSKVVEGRRMNSVEQMSNGAAFKTLPVTDVDKALLGHHIDFLQEWMQHPNNDSYWEEANFNSRMRAMPQIPALHVSGWFDGDGIGTKRNYQAMVESGHKNQKLIYGPWTHAINSSTKLGSIEFGPQSVRDLDTIYLRWFDHWLKGVKNGIEKEPPVEAFLMGANQWRHFSAWPPKESKPSRWYLHSAGKAGADQNSGTLSTDPPDIAEPPDKYAYDPADPFMLPEMRALLEPATKSAGSAPTRDPDVLTYTSAPLETDLTVAGPISMHIAAATSARDTDWFALVEDIGPDNTAFPLVQGIAEARFRNSYSTPTLLRPGEVANYTIDLWATGHVFAKGHRLRVLLTSSCFPLYARNLNTGDNNLTTTGMVTAQQTIYHTASRRSYLILPTLPR